MTGHHIGSYLSRMNTSSNLSPRRYELRIDGHLDARWTTSFDRMTLLRENDGTTVLRGSLPDQTALHGLLAQLRDAGLPLLSVTQLDGAEASTRMTAAVYRRFGGPEVVSVEDVPKPQPEAGEMLVRVRATTVSAADHRTRARDVPPGLLLPSALVIGLVKPRRPILGMDIAGTIVAVGAGVTGFAPGDDVVAMLGGRFGGHAEYAIVKTTDAVALKPESLSFEDAVAHVFGGITARAYLRQVDIGPGSRVLVNGASGAVGTAVVQLAASAGAIVTGVCSAANRELVTSLGANRVIDYATHDFATDGSTYDVIVDCVGNAPVNRVHKGLAAGGAVLLVAADLSSLLSAKGHSRRLGISVVTGPGPYRADDLEYLMSLAEQGSLRPTIEKTFSLAEIADAHRLVDSGRKRGSVVITIPGA